MRMINPTQMLMVTSFFKKFIYVKNNIQLILILILKIIIDFD